MGGKKKYIEMFRSFTESFNFLVSFLGCNFCSVGRQFSVVNCTY